MKYCSNCGNKLEEGVKTCPNCNFTISSETPLAQNSVNSVKPSTNGFAIAGLILGIVSILCCGSTSVLGLVFSIIGYSNAKKNNDNSKGIAVAGIVISSVGILILLVFNIIGFGAYFYDGYQGGYYY